jgi:hypothetical protein
LSFLWRSRKGSAGQGDRQTHGKRILSQAHLYSPFDSDFTAPDSLLGSRGAVIVSRHPIFYPTGNVLDFFAN